ncbi:MAG: hypothetical protein ABIG90_00560 [bacterium]
MTKHQKLTLILTLTLGLIFVVFLPRAQAGFWDTVTAGALTATLGWIVWLIMQLLSLGIYIGGALFDWLLSWKITDLPIITEGWKIIRDLANISFIFILLTIAISTILGIEKYGAKKLFVNLVIIALLVNFSMLLVNVVLDMSYLFTKFFVEQSGVGNWEMSQKLVGSLGVAKVWQAAGNNVSAGNIALNFLINMIMGVVVLLATLIVIWLAAGLLVVRAIVLSFVAIFAPAAFLCRVIPGAEKYWGQWWKSLISWALFTPAFAFFLYLAMRTADSFDSFKNSLGTAAPNLQSSVSSFFSTGNNLIQYILVLGFTLGGLLMAKQFGVQGGAKIYGMAQAGLKKASGYTSVQEAIKSYKAARAKGKEAGAAAKLGTRLSYMRDAAVGATLGRIPLVNKLGGTQAQKRAKSAKVNFLAGEHEGKVPADLLPDINTGSAVAGGASNAKAAAAAKAFIKEGHARIATLYPINIGTTARTCTTQQELLEALREIIKNY